MKLEDRVTNIKLSNKLKELGVKQDYKRGDFVWFKFANKPERWNLSIVDTHGSEHKCNYCGCECEVCYPHANKDGVKAFTVAELGIMLPKIIEDDEDGNIFELIIFNLDSIWYIAYHYTKTDENVFVEEAKTESNARAKMLIYLLENKLIKN